MVVAARTLADGLPSRPKRRASSFDSTGRTFCVMRDNKLKKSEERVEVESPVAHASQLHEKHTCQCAHAKRRRQSSLGIDENVEHSMVQSNSAKDRSKMRECASSGSVTLHESDMVNAHQPLAASAASVDSPKGSQSSRCGITLGLHASIEGVGNLLTSLRRPRW